MRVEGHVLDRLTLAGHGEPTLHPAFPEIVEALRALRDEAAPGLPIGILSNSATAHQPAVRAALLRLDERNMKLDVGRQDDLRRVNASSAAIEQIVDALAALPDIAIQSMFVRDRRQRIDNTRADSVEAWLVALARIAPRIVQIYTIARAPALPDLEPVPADVLEALAGQVRARGISALVAG